MVKVSRRLSFGETIVRPSPATGAERDDNKLFAGNFDPGSVILFDQSYAHTPDRDYLMRYPQGLWSGKSLASDADFRHIPGWSGSANGFASPQDMKAVRQLAGHYRALTAHVPNLDKAVDIAEGQSEADPYGRYRSTGHKDQGRESSLLHELPLTLQAAFRRGLLPSQHPYEAQRSEALEIREERKAQQAERIKAFKDPLLIPGTGRFRWQTPVVPGHPLHVTSSYQRARRVPVTDNKYLDLGARIAAIQPHPGVKLV